MRPRFELGVDPTEYWGSMKKFITVPVGRVHTLPARFSTDLHGRFTELRVEIRDARGCRTPWRGTGDATVEMVNIYVSGYLCVR